MNWRGVAKHGDFHGWSELGRLGEPVRIIYSEFYLLRNILFYWDKERDPLILFGLEVNQFLSCNQS